MKRIISKHFKIMLSEFPAWRRTIRPHTLPLVIVPIILGITLLYDTHQHPDWRLIGGGLWLTFFVHIAIELFHHRRSRSERSVLTDQRIDVAGYLSLLKAATLLLPITFLPGWSVVVGSILVVYLGYSYVLFGLMKLP